jgi:hypothetical protein
MIIHAKLSGKQPAADLGRHRPAVQPALELIAAQMPQQGPLILVRTVRAIRRIRSRRLVA